MSSHATASAAAPWKSTFLAHIDKMESPEFVLATIQPASGDKPHQRGVPRARYCIYRGMWAQLPENKHNTAPRNPCTYETELPTLTTDVRMHKVEELFATSAGGDKGESHRQIEGSGGGGPVEAVWWIKEAMTQWRIEGDAFVVASDIDDATESSGVRTVKSEIGKRMRVIEPGKENEWSWRREVTAQFGNCSPAIRGSFRAPPPGRPVSEPYDDESLKLGEKADSVDDEVARKHFRVVIIRPRVVEQLNLSDMKRARRHRYTIVGENEWKTEELWP